MQLLAAIAREVDACRVDVVALADERVERGRHIDDGTDGIDVLEQTVERFRFLRSVAWWRRRRRPRFRY